MDNRLSDLTAVILAGGKGTRLRPLTAVFPKPLVPIGDRSVLEILLARLARFGFKKIIISTGYLAEIIMAVCGDGEKYGLEISYVSEEEPLGTAAPLSKMQGLSDPFVIMNGDLLTTLNYAHMIGSHIESGSDITIGTYSREVKIDFGVIQKNDHDEFYGFIEKPTYTYDVSMGVNVLNRSVLKHIAYDTYLDMPDLILKVYNDNKKINCYKEDCFWLDIGRMEDYAEAQDIYSENKSMFLET